MGNLVGELKHIHLLDLGPRAGGEPKNGSSPDHDPTPSKPAKPLWRGLYEYGVARRREGDAGAVFRLGGKGCGGAL